MSRILVPHLDAHKVITHFDTTPTIPSVQILAVECSVRQSFASRFTLNSWSTLWAYATESQDTEWYLSTMDVGCTIEWVTFKIYKNKIASFTVKNLLQSKTWSKTLWFEIKKWLVLFDFRKSFQKVSDTRQNSNSHILRWF